MAKTQPTLIKVGDKGAYVNLNSCVSIGVVKGQVQNVLKEGWKATAEKKEPTGEDYTSVEADTLSFYFIGRDELILRVGMEIDEAEFEKVRLIIEEIEYEPRDARISTSNKSS